ncbi:MAG: hypothetical protein MK193_07615 [Lentisphaeria bacterium]|nr:hypothetical protein [Lentisphaeria bacterium]
MQLDLTVSALVDKLDSIGYFEDFNSADKDTIIEVINYNLEVFGHEDLLKYYPGISLMSVLGDSFCIQDRGDYTELIHKLASGSFSYFSPRYIEEHWLNNRIDISFQLNGIPYALVLDYDGYEQFDLELIDTINHSLEEQKLPYKYYSPHVGWEKDFGYIFTTPAKYQLLCKEGLLPVADEDENC